LEFGIWKLELGIWNLEFGIWNLILGAFLKQVDAESDYYFVV